jgi:hypothetical protein
MIKTQKSPTDSGLFLEKGAALRVSLREGFSGIVRVRNGFVQKARFMIVFEQVKSFLCV